MSIKTALEKEILDEIEYINKLEVGSKEHKDATEAFERLLKQYNDMEKTELEYQDKSESRDKTSELKKLEIEQSRSDTKLKTAATIGTAIFGSVLTTGVTVWGICKSLKFEEEGVYRSPISRGLLQKILPNKNQVS